MLQEPGNIMVRTPTQVWTFLSLHSWAQGQWEGRGDQNHSKIIEILTGALLWWAKSCAFLSQIRRSSNIHSSFLVKTFSWMQVSPQVSYEKKQSSWETEKAYTSATLAWTFCLLGQLNIRERGVKHREEERKKKGRERKGRTHANTWDYTEIYIWRFISIKK